LQIRTLGKLVLGAEAAATAKSALKINELRERVQGQVQEILDLGKQMDAKEHEFDKHTELMNVWISVRCFEFTHYSAEAIQKAASLYTMMPTCCVCGSSIL
jgi:hypothetical protein